MRGRTSALCAFLIVLWLSSCGPSPKFDPRAAVTKLFEAWNLRQEQVVRDLLADDVVWELMGHTYRGKNEVVQFIAFDDGMGSRLELANVTVEKDTVNLELLESNDFMAALGVPQLRSFVRIVFADGKVKHSSETRPPQGTEELEAAWGELGAWLETNHPDALAAMYGADGAPARSREAGRSLVGLAREWKSAIGGR
jgi:hypothetical protein